MLNENTHVIPPLVVGIDHYVFSGTTSGIHLRMDNIRQFKDMAMKHLLCVVYFHTDNAQLSRYAHTIAQQVGIPIHLTVNPTDDLDNYLSICDIVYAPVFLEENNKQAKVAGPTNTEDLFKVLFEFCEAGVPFSNETYREILAKL